MWEEAISKLPPEATIIFAIALAILYFARQLGFKTGAENKPETSAQVAAVIVDSKALNAATSAVEALNMTLIEYNMLTKKMLEVDQELNDELSKLRVQIEISREVNRRL